MYAAQDRGASHLDRTEMKVVGLLPLWGLPLKVGIDRLALVPFELLAFLVHETRIGCNRAGFLFWALAHANSHKISLPDGPVLPTGLTLPSAFNSPRTFTTERRLATM